MKSAESQRNIKRGGVLDKLNEVGKRSINSGGKLGKCSTKLENTNRLCSSKVD